MTNWIFIIAGLLVFPFFEHIFRAAGLISLFAILALLIEGRLDMRRFLALLTFVAVVLDVSFHLSLGTHLLAVSGMLLFANSLKRILPSDNFLSESVVNILVFTFYTSLFALIVSLQNGSGFTVLSWYLLGTSIVKALLGVVLYQAGVLLMSYTRGDIKSTLKMRR